MAERSADWMEQADRDLKMAHLARAEGFFEWVCFISQQASEKAIKAVYQKEGAVAWGHSNTDLLRGLEQKHPVPKEILISARKLDRFYIPSRYPDGFGEGKPADFFDGGDADDAISSAGRIIQFCAGLLA
jgi:HEPN domain-containing protein